MDKVFISYHFDDNAKRLAADVQEILHYHNLQYETGKRLGGGDVTAEIKDRIKKCNGLICLMTERPEDRNNNWVLGELTFADAEGKPTIILSESDQGPGGMFGGRERIPFDAANPEKALLDLVNTIGIWRQKSGRKLVVQIEPAIVADFVNNHIDDVTVEYRLYEDGNMPDWKRADARPKGDAVLVTLSGIRSEDIDVELRVRYGDKKYKSRVESQYFRMRLNEDQS